MRIKKKQTEVGNSGVNPSSLASELLEILAAGSTETFWKILNNYLPSTYCIVMLLDDRMNLITRAVCRLRGLQEESSSVGAVFPADRLKDQRSVFNTRQSLLCRFESSDIDHDLKALIPKKTRTILVVPLGTASERQGVIIFGEERLWSRAPFTDDKIQLAVAISKQIASGVQLLQFCDKQPETSRTARVSQIAVREQEGITMLGEVARAVEHEINNPLSVIVNWSELYRDDESIDAELRNKFQIIYDMSLRIAAVTRRLGEIKEGSITEFIKGSGMTEIK